MKKTFWIIGLVLTMLAVGCSEKSEMQMTPLPIEEPGNRLIELSNFDGVEVGKASRVAIKFDNYDRLQPLHGMIKLVDEEIFELVSHQKKRNLINKLSSLALMYNDHNVNGFVEKLEKDVISKLGDYFVNSAEAEAFGYLLTIQKILAEEPDVPLDAVFIPSAQLAVPIVVAIITAGVALVGIIVEALDDDVKLMHAGDGGVYYYYSNGEKCAYFPPCTDFYMPSCSR